MDITSHLIEKCKSLLVLEISDVEYCLDNAIISTIIKTENKFQTNSTETLKYSQLNIGDKSIPLIDLKNTLTNEKLKIDENSRIMIIEFNDMKFGLLAEKVKEIIALDMKFITTSLQFIPELNGRYIEGTLEFEERKIILLNIEKILTDTGCI